MSETDQTKPLPGFLSSMVASVARHGLTSAASALATFGVIQASQSSEFIDLGLSVVLWGAGLWWSAIQKKNVVKAVNGG